MKNVLMIAYAFPPMIASGSARPASFAKYLKGFGYRPTVITRPPRNNESPDVQSLRTLDGCCDIINTPVGDNDDWAGWIQKRFRLLDWLTRPVSAKKNWFSSRFEWGYRRFWPGLRDNVHWVWPAVFAGLRALRKKRYDIIWATGDPWSSLQVGYWLSKLTRKPLVADIRDPWTYGVLWNPFDKAEAARTRRWELRVINRATRTVYTSPKTEEIMKKRLPDSLSERILTITNGYDDMAGDTKRSVPVEKCCFCYIGKLTSNHRKPDILLEGFRIARLDPELKDDVCLHFIGQTGNYAQKLASYEVDDGIICSGIVPYETSLSFMRGTDVLVLLQTIKGSGKDVISGKLYEYLAARRPILAITDKDGGDAWMVRSLQAGLITGIESAEDVAEGIRHFWRQWKQGQLKSHVPLEKLDKFSRPELTGSLARLFDEVLSTTDKKKTIFV